ncbi:hypothetical protein AN191_17460 [Loktanella sp. 5RATIMAR09]|uniref:hypothetical protein n=1 Tax=Loktanella sp. 5RATIMAR09 TaxID=1225655 RepID=UPI0006EBAC41|nr:hypothetical protein [Loktanella sp. 5RATIMAR09]KQI70570.1 hypothetical protein AN191_17460 [Loktanella sp. 5RATIMAR09]
MKTASVLAVVVAAVAIGFGIYMVDINQTEEASLPDVDVTVEEGNMPEFNAEVGDIETGTEEITLEVPTVDIESPEEDDS